MAVAHIVASRHSNPSEDLLPFIREWMEGQR
jgi:hypothetical protein